MAPLLPGSSENFNPSKLRSKLSYYNKSRKLHLKKFELNNTGSNNCNFYL